MTERQQVGSLACNCVCTKVTVQKQDFNYLLTCLLSSPYTLPFEIHQHGGELMHFKSSTAAVARHKRALLTCTALFTGSDVCFLWVVADKRGDDGQACSC